MFKIRQYCGSDKEAWNSFVASSKNGTFLFERDYMEYHNDRFTDASLLIADQSGRLIAILPASRVGDRVISHGGLTYGGLVSNERMTTVTMVDVFAAVCRRLAEHGVKTMVYKTIPTIYHRLPAEEDRYALFVHGATLCRRDVLSVIEAGAEGPVQERRARGARKAERAGVEIEESTQLHEFWPVLTANLQQSHDRQPVHSVEEIQSLRDRFPAEIRLFVAKQGGLVVAGALLYLSGHTAHIQYIGSSDGGRQIGALDLLFFRVIEQFRNMRYVDFGISNEADGRYLNRGLVEFKEGFGARTVVHDHYLLSLA